MPAMMTTDSQAKYFAYDLTRRYAPDSAERLAGAVAGAQVDLNPHQVDAALFAFTSPLSKGALLADEVGLGKTIEAGLVISQKWAERKRRILIITPSNLRKQWHQELTEKFFLPCAYPGIEVIQSSHQAGGNFRPLDLDGTVVICSYQFARSKAADVQRPRGTWWSSTRPTACATSTSRRMSSPTPSSRRSPRSTKLLLTATPLQNSLLELFGLVSFIDEHTFGDLKSFREQFANLHARSRSFNAPEGAAEADLPSHAAPPGHHLRPLHARLSDGARNSRRRKVRTGSTSWSPNISAATICRPCPPASGR